jgi:copper chaperone
LPRTAPRAKINHGGNMQQYNVETPDRVANVWETRVLGIEGMTCDNCVKTLTKALTAINGVKDVQVDRASARASITFDTTKTNIPAIHETILRSGYKPTREIPK